MRYVRAGDDLQAALNAARPGDELRLAPQTTFTGNFVLPVTTGSSTITVRTDLADNELPGPRQRVSPATAARFARIASPNSAAALRTAPGAHHWLLKFLEFPATKDGYGDIIQLGDGSDAQVDLAQVPYEIELDRVYVHGDRVQGQKRGIALNARAVTIRNSHVSDIKGVGIDTQAIGGWNGPGPFLIENNYLEATGEVVLLGGSDPAIPNLVSSDVIVRNNHMTRPMAWRNDIVPAPGGVAAVGAGSGSLPAGVYAYRVVARQPSGAGTVATSLPSDEVTAVASSGAITVTWNAVPDATEYQVYVRNPAGATQYWSVSAPSFVHNTTAGGRSGTPPASATKWQVKNLFELKNARRVKIEYNLFENNWQAAQPGYAILFTPRNQGGQCTWCIIEQVDFSNNMIRNVAGGFNIAGYDSNGVTGQTNTITIANNVIYDVTTAMGGAGWPFLVGDAVRDLTIERNTIDFDGTTLLYAYGGTKSAPRQMPGFRFSSNATRHGQYGINGADASTGTLTIQMYFPASVITGNWISGGSSSRYPEGNSFQEPFEIKWPSAGDPILFAQGPGANLRLLVNIMDNVQKGLMVTAPVRPDRVRVIW
ncbi:MAG TPA: hypothetical protein VFK57_01260 [Vicinamibacterales bacterium]|nr:hypothetical protein [Vicinamibacterales bacterium]